MNVDLTEVRLVILGALKSESGADLQGLQVTDEGVVSFALEMPPGAASAFEPKRQAIEAAVAALPGVRRVRAVLTSEAAPRPPAPEAVVAVASAKGGVGKSTVSVNLAVALAQLGLEVGLLDADVFGPSLPTMLGVRDARPAPLPEKRISPVEAHGVQTLSVGYLVDPEEPMIWRGAMVANAVRQLLEQGAWGRNGKPLDILLLDQPPGTGDAHLTLAQRAPLAGAVIVSTPQEVALADVRRGLAMFSRTETPVLGVIENMAYFDTAGGGREYPFGQGGARRTAEAFGAPFLGELPLLTRLRESCDAGAPLVAAEPDHPISLQFRTMAQAMLNNLARSRRPLPAIRFE